jgi:hypothetical protein
MLMTLTADRSHMPVGLVPMQDAVSDLATALDAGNNRVQALHSDERVRFRTADRRLDIPAPVVMVNYDHEPEDYVELTERAKRNVSRRVLFARDRFTCQYCGTPATPGRTQRELTVDHVKPAHLFRNRKEATSWENVVACCVPCNRKKGGKLPRDCGMMLPRGSSPKEPHFVQLRFTGRLNAVQRDYVSDYFKLDTVKVPF